MRTYLRDSTLDQILQQLGIDPNSTPLSEQLSMVLYLDDPSSLAQLVQSLGQVVQTTQLKNPAAAPAAQTQDARQVAAPAGNTAAAAAVTANQNAPNPASPVANGFAAQFQELQVSLQALGANGFASAAAGATGGALNVVA